MWPFAKHTTPHHNYTGRALYDLSSAIRGCDTLTYSSTAEVLKLYLTARVRSILFSTDDKPSENVYNSQPLSSDDMKVIREVFTKPDMTAPCSDHFIMHLKMAVHKSKRHQIWSSYADEIVELLEKKEYGG